MNENTYDSPHIVIRRQDPYLVFEVIIDGEVVDDWATAPEVEARVADALAGYYPRES